MIAEIVAQLGSATLAVSTLIVAILFSRTPVRRRFGAQTAYLLWLCVPVAGLAALFPAPVPVDRAVAVMLPALTHGPTASAMPHAALDPAIWLFGLWLSGVGASVALMVRQQVDFVRAIGRVSRSAEGLWQSTRTATGPALVGALRPRIVLPADFAIRYTPRERDLILAHERTHRSRGDAQANALAAALRCLLWFNPLVYLAMSRFRLDQELACDAAVIARFPGARRTYAGAILKTQLDAHALPVGCHWHAGHPLKERIAMLKSPLPGRARRACGLLFVCILGASASYVAWATQPRAAARPEASVAQVVDAQIVVTVGGEAPKKLRLVNPVDQPFMAKGDRADPWQAEFTASPVPGGNIRLAMNLRQGGATIGQPVILVEPNKSSSVEVSYPHGRSRFRIEATLALHEAGWKPVAAPRSAPAL
ncbi:MAG: M56 family metallopeptidase [Rhodanobacteraceae bacterium]